MDKGKPSAVRAVVRIRPFLAGEPTDKCIFIDPADKQIAELVDLRYANTATRYKFDSCYDVDATQEELFRCEVSPHIPKLFNGLNTTIFCYGMTGAGKTHTMHGSKSDPGIIPRALREVFEVAKRHSQQKADTIRISVSYFEIYNDKVNDLADLTKQDLPIRQDSQNRIVISGLSEIPISTMSEFERFYEEKSRNRSTAPTKLNSRSSRSHAILMVKVVVRQSAPPYRQYEGKLHLIDLAGSEDNRKTDNKGERMTESSNINTSLFVLAKVVNALNAGASRIPYRDSKLTRLLQDSLGGSSYGVIIANVAPGYAHYINTQHTLNFATKSRQITNTPITNVQDAESLYQARLSAEKEQAATLVKQSAPVAEKLGVNTSKSMLPPKTPHSKIVELTSMLEQARHKEKAGQLGSALKLFEYVLQALSEDEDKDPDVIEGLNKRISRIKLQIASSLKEEMKLNLMEDKENVPNTSTPPSTKETKPAKRSTSSEPLEVEESLPPSKKVRKTPAPDPKYIEQAVINELSAHIKRSRLQYYCQKLVETLNTADEAMLTTLSGIGIKRAQAIVEFRKGSQFKTIGDLTEIGMGLQGISTFVKRNILERMWFSSVDWESDSETQ